MFPIKYYVSEERKIVSKYCIAFVPISYKDDLVSLLQEVPTNDKQYKLGDKSIPHITLCQFNSEDNKVDELWEEIIENIENQNLSLSLDVFSCITFDEKMYWISLIPSNSEDLHIIQKKISSILKASISRPYDPHLTLLGTSDKDFKSKADPFMKDYKTIIDDFILTIGHCDEIGQFTSIIHQCEPQNSFKCGF